MPHGRGIIAQAVQRRLQKNETFKLEEIPTSSSDHQVSMSDYFVYALPKHHMPTHSIPADVVYQSICDLRQLDHNPRLNMASFVTTSMEPEAEKLIKQSLNVNFVDVDQYPSCTDIHNRCVNMLADLYHAPDSQEARGAGSIGSSEAIMLAGLAFKKRWMAKRRAEGKPIDKPNMVMAASVQVCWEKFCRYFDVEEKYVPLEKDRYVLTPELAKPLIDENTIGVVGILGSTYNGEFEDIQGLNDMVEELKKETGLEVPIHVDAASGGFIAPFLYPDLVWDFRLPNVKSINVSGHKYGLVYAGIGWVLWREKEDLPEDLVFHLNYLGSDQASVTLNFSRGASHIIAQYFQLLRLGREGYTRIMNNLNVVARKLQDGILETGYFEVLNKEQGVPLVAFTLKERAPDEDGEVKPRAYDEYDISDRLKEHGWVIPAYTMAPNAQSVKLLRVVIRMDHSMTIIEKLIDNIREAIEILEYSEKVSEEHFRQLRLTFKKHTRPDNPHRQIKTTGQC